MQAPCQWGLVLEKVCMMEPCAEQAIAVIDPVAQSDYREKPSPTNQPTKKTVMPTIQSITPVGVTYSLGRQSLQHGEVTETPGFRKKAQVIISRSQLPNITAM